MTETDTTYLSSQLHRQLGRSAWRLFVLSVLLWGSPSAFAAPIRSDTRSLLELFGEAVSRDVLEVRRLVRGMKPEQRYDYLLREVLPPEANRIRIAIDFLPTNPSPRVIEKYGSGKMPLIPATGEIRIPSGGVLVSPAIDLIDAALQLGKLEELKETLTERSPAESEQIKAQSALLILIAAAQGEREQYAGRLIEFMTLVRETPVTDPERAPELVVVWKGAEAAETRSDIRDLLFFLCEQMKSGANVHRERVKRHVFSLNHLLDEQIVQHEREIPPGAGQKNVEHWQPVSRRTARTRGEGFPSSAWSASPTRARHISSHGDDYLYFASPLRGEFEIEGDLSTFGYREIRLAVGTVWAGPLYDHERMSWGNFRQEMPHIRLEKRFASLGDQMHTRVVVRNGLRTTYVIGRKVFTSPQESTSDPWIAAYGPWHTSGEVQNLRITGNPEIPEEIDLIARTDLPGWLPYYRESAGQPGNHWSLAETRPASWIERINPFRERPPRILTGRTSNAPAGSFQESLLRYHRPMLEDGTIEYEFYYQQNQYAVFPALDRVAFVFNAEQAGIHWLTDGIYDVTGVDPANFSASQLGHAPQLRADDWNHVKLALKGDLVEVVLNGASILSHKLEPENLRTFGLFHYSDQTTVMIRNLRWRGEWPKELPPLEDQELADVSLEEELAGGPELRTVFAHDFSEGLPQDQIWCSGHNWQQGTEERSNGLFMKRSGGSYEKNSLSLPFRLAGDFDVTWEFEDFLSNTVKGGNGNLQILILLDDDVQTEIRLHRKQWLQDSGAQAQLLQPAIFYTKPDGKTHYGFLRDIPEESTGGKLRLVRRGTDMYFLYAENDSENFRLAYQVTVPDAPTLFGGIKGIIETHQEGDTAAVWKCVTVKAESTPDMLKSTSLSPHQLDEQKSQLSQSASFEFNRETDLRQIVIHGDLSHVMRGNDGWLVSQPGFDTWQGTWIKPHLGLHGDFDVTLDLEVMKLEQSKPGSESTVFLHVDFATERTQALEIKYSKAANSPPSLEIQMNVPGRNGGARYEELKHQQADEVAQLRLARRGSIAYLIARRSAESEPEVFGRIEVGTAEIPRDSLAIGIHTGGSGQETMVRLKSMKIHAEQFK